MLLAADVEIGISAWTLLALLSIPALIALNGFFVAAEFALVAVRRTKVEEMVRKGIPGAKAVETAIEHLDHSIAATQLGITLASIALGMVAEPVLARLFEPMFSFLPFGWKLISAHALGSALAFALITFLHVIFGELMPKAIALQTTDAAAVWVSGPLNVFARLSRPIVSLMNGTGNWLLQRLGFKPASGEETVHSIDELALLIEDTEEAGVLDPDQADLVQNIFLLSSKRVRDCMVPREKLMALELTTPPESILEAVRSGAHTRMPVYEGELNNIVGIVNTKDLFFLFSLKNTVVLHDALYPPQFLDPDMRIGDALKKFKTSHHPMAVVRDPNQVVLGLLTLEDILEEIVGDLEDEHDGRVPKLRIIPNRFRRR